ncbi:MAG TPA: TIGR00730 family Rossman fold protein [Anaeromyxobacter sp.]|nr:TIGR00730 family Rossman fold protein [Anaeromyxobacter sp.]
MRICLFCGSSAGRRPEHAAVARELGRALARRGIGLVNGGGHVGLMGAAADGASELGGETIGVIPRALMDRELGHKGMTELRVVETMHERKALMAELSDGFAALPGGIGTLEELFEAWTWAGLGIHQKPVGVLNIGGYWDPLLAMADRMVEQGFLPPHLRTALLVAREPDALIDAFVGYRPAASRWSSPEVKP